MTDPRTDQGGTFDDDAGWCKLADRIAAIAAETGRKDFAIVRDLPAGEGRGWSDWLRESSSQSPAPNY